MHGLKRTGRVERTAVNNPRFRNIFIYVLIGIAILVIVFGVRSSGQQTNDLSIGRLAQMIDRIYKNRSETSNKLSVIQ